MLKYSLCASHKCLNEAALFSLVVTCVYDSLKVTSIIEHFQSMN